MARRKPPEEPKPKKTLGELTDELWEAREDYRRLSAEKNAAEKKVEDLSLEMIERMDAEHLESMRGKKASLSITPSIVPKIEDWDRFLAWTIKSKNLHLLHRRIATEGWRELCELKGVPPPGTVAFPKKTLHMLSINQS